MSILNKFQLRDRVVVVTGASSGLGVAFAQAFAQAGADLVLGARRLDGLEKTAALVRAEGRDVLTVPTDVADPEACQRLIDEAMRAFGRVDVLIANAGVSHAVPATRETPAEFRSTIDVNLNGTYWCAQAAARVMQPGSSIINVSSVLASTTAGFPQAAYVASKAGVEGLTRDLAQQWGLRKGIRVNALAPGFFATEMTAEYPEDYLENVIEPRILLGRMGDATELAATAVWMASEAGGYLTGQVIGVDGGVSIT